MRKYFSLFFVAILLSTIANVQSQVPKESWGVGFGVAYPRLMNTNIFRGEDSYGGFLSLERNFTEHVGLRLRASYLNVTGESGNWDLTTTAFMGNLDVLYNFVPCESVSPFIAFGAGYGYFEPDVPAANDTYLDYELNFGVGAKWQVGKKWDLKTELGYHTMSNSSFDGFGGPSPAGGLLGVNEDAYMTFDLGLVYYFDQGEPSKLCQIYEGVKVENMPDEVDYERIENIVKKHIPREVVKEVVVGEKDQKPTYGYNADEDKWVLVGVNFGFNSAKLRQEAYPVLFHAALVLLQNPSLEVEIQGYTDNIGSSKYNQKLSEKRPQAVMDYLVARGVDASRLTTVGYGEKMPIADNKTADGRAMNRRIEFKVK